MRRGPILRGFGRSVGMPQAIKRSPFRSPYAAPGRLLFLVSIAVGLCRASSLSESRKYLRSQGKSQARGAGRSVLGDRRTAADEAPSGAAAVSNGRVAALARQARPEIPPAAGELAVQRPARRRRRDRRDRTRP